MSQHSHRPTEFMDRFPWGIELIALVANLLSMAALVIVLAACDRKPIFYWHRVTLNTIVSIISTAAKAPILFVVAESISQWKWMVFSRRSRRLLDFQTIDSASRGPLGSLKLLWSCRYDFALQLGAIITVISIAIDPFSQQLIQYELNSVNVSTVDANIVRAKRYSRGIEFRSPKVYLHGYPISNAQANADFAMQAAILYGLTHSLEDMIKQVELKCPSGNCTWDPFESLAVCSICNDVATHVTVEKSSGFSLIAAVGSGSGYNIPTADSVTKYVPASDTVTKFKLPNGLFIDHTPNTDRIKTAWMTSFGTGNRDETVSLRDIDTLIWGMSFLRPHDNDSANWADVEIEAIECGLYYCVNRYTATVENNGISEFEEPVANASRSADSWKPDTDVAALESLGLLDSLNFNPTLPGVLRSDLMLGDNFNISQSAVDGISSFFQQTFLRSTDTNRSNPLSYISGFSHSATNFEPTAMQPFISIPDLRVPFVSLARSMTNSLRANSDDPPQTGRIRVLQAYYVIVWPWIALHAVVVITGTAFMLVTIREARKHGVPIWTSSALAIISEGDNARDVLKGSVTRRDLERRAEVASLQLGVPGKVGETTSTQVLALEELHFSDSDTYPPEESTQNDVEARRRGPQSAYSAISTLDTL